MARPNDARAVRSREAIRGALLRLILQKPLEQISIKELTTAAGVSYPVFFRQFSRKEDVLDDIAAGEVERLIEYSMPLFEAGSADAAGAALCQYVERHRELWTRLLTAGAASAMRDEFRRIARQFSANRGRRNPQVPLELASNLVVSGIFEIFSWWLRQPADYPIANVVKMLNKLVVEPITRPIELED
jgi:AcrR family transcriptional regulator